MGLTPPKIENFTFVPGITLRATILGGEPWFVSADICKALDIQNPATSIARLDPSDKQKLNFCLPGKAPWLISEAGLYEFVLRSRKTEAREFSRWVTKEVLPAIRKDGGYVTQATAQAMVDDPEVMLSKALLFATNRLKAAEEQVVTLTAENIKLEIRGKGLEENAVADMTVKQFVASRKIALTRGQRTALGNKAGVLGDCAGRPKIKVASSFVANDGSVRQGVTGIYPISALERAATAMGLKENSYA